MSWTISLWQEAIKRSWWTSDTWSSTQIGSQLKASRTTCHKQQVVFDHVSFFFGGGFSPVKKHGPTIKKEKHHRFHRGKKPGPFPRAGFPITKDLMIEDNKKITGISGCTLSISFWIDPGESWRKNDRDTPRWNSVHSSKLTYIGAVFTEPFATRAPLSTVRFPKNDDQECLCSQSPCKNAHANWQSSLKGLLLPSQWITFLIKGPSQCFW